MPSPRPAHHAIAPAGTLLAIVLSYTYDSPNLLLTLLSAMVLLMLLTGQVARERRWQAAGIDFSPELRLDMALAGFGLSMALLTASVLAPMVSVRPIVRFAQRLLVEHLSQGKQIADSMGLEPLAGPGIGLNAARAAGLPNQSLIGSGPELSDEVVMLIKLEGHDWVYEPPSSPFYVPPPSFYWRSVTYDNYNGRGWRTTGVDTVSYLAGEPATYGAEPFYKTATAPDAYQTLRQDVQIEADLGGLLYRAGELLTADQDFNVSWRSPNDAFGAEIRAKNYRADSLVPVVSEAQLRATGDDYPAWVLEHYLDLPPEVPERVLTLAHDLTEAEPTPYDQARAIETYLRAFTYTLDLPAPPPNREVADYFLFDLRQGYCDYYATTMVVLARAAGLPARFVSGYVGGSYDAERGRYIVTAAEGHSWVEIYFSGYGWIEFEPTGGRPAIVRPADTTPLDIPEPQAALGPRIDEQLTIGQIMLMGLLSVFAPLGLGGLAWWSIDRWRLVRLSPAGAVAAVYQRLYRHGQRLDVTTVTGDTPYEFATSLTTRVTQLARDRGVYADLDVISRQVHGLAELHVQGLYSPREPGAAEKSQAIRTWRRLRGQLWRAWVWQRTDRGND
jgi:transglutaminase-like putative cysteine protease